MASADVEYLPVPADLGFHYFPPSVATRHGLSRFVDECKTNDDPVMDNASWKPNFEQYMVRIQQARLTTPTILPPEWPAFLNSPLAWKGEDFPDTRVYTHNLTKNELEEIEVALVKVKGKIRLHSQNRSA